MSPSPVTGVTGPRDLYTREHAAGLAAGAGAGGDVAGGEAGDVGADGYRERLLAAGAPTLTDAQQSAYPHYPVQFVQMRHSTRMSTDVSIEALLTKGWGPWTAADRVVIEQVAPDERPVLTQGWAGGTWGGRCGSTRWVRTCGADVPERVQTLVAALAALRALGAPGAYVQDVFGDEGARRTQAWALNGIGASRGLDGFRVFCDQAFRHEGLCRAEAVEGGVVWTWDQHAQVPTDDHPGDLAAGRS